MGSGEKRAESVSVHTASLVLKIVQVCCIHIQWEHV